MRSFARTVAIAIVGIGSLTGLILCVIGLGTLDSYRGGLGWMGVGFGVGAFLSSGASGCILYLLADIDERLSAAGWRTAAEEVGSEAAARADSYLGGEPLSEPSVGTASGNKRPMAETEG